jgi:hypothetical protein
MTTTAIAKGAFMKAGYSSLLPGLFDSTVPPLSGHRVGAQFSYGRSTGQSSDFVTGNPSYNLVKSGLGVGDAILGVTNPDYRYSKENNTDIRRLSFFGNSYGIKNLFNLLAAGKPARSTKQEQ